LGRRVRLPRLQLDQVLAGQPGTRRPGLRTCAKRTSVTTGTVFASTRSPLTQWFAAAWHVCATKNGASALGLQKLLGLGRYETTWT
jgi:hypothetical protein